MHVVVLKNPPDGLNNTTNVHAGYGDIGRWFMLLFIESLLDLFLLLLKCFCLMCLG